MRTFVAVLALVMVSGCDGGVTAPAVPLTGLWAGNSGGATVTANLVQAGTSVTGTGSVDGFGLSTDFSVTGSYVLESVILTLYSPTYGAFQFSGTKNGATITGLLTSKSYPDFPVTLTRQ